MSATHALAALGFVRRKEGVISACSLGARRRREIRWPLSTQACTAFALDRGAKETDRDRDRSDRQGARRDFPCQRSSRRQRRTAARGANGRFAARVLDAAAMVTPHAANRRGVLTCGLSSLRATPADDCLGLDDEEDAAPTRPWLGEAGPEDSVDQNGRIGFGEPQPLPRAIRHDDRRPGRRGPSERRPSLRRPRPRLVWSIRSGRRRRRTTPGGWSRTAAGSVRALPNGRRGAWA